MQNRLIRRAKMNLTREKKLVRQIKTPAIEVIITTTTEVRGSWKPQRGKGNYFCNYFKLRCYKGNVFD